MTRYMAIVRSAPIGSTMPESIPRKKAFGRLLPAVAVSLVQGIAVGVGLVLLILPGLWLMARFVAALPLVATDEPDPVQVVWPQAAEPPYRQIFVVGGLVLVADRQQQERCVCGMCRHGPRSVRNVVGVLRPNLSCG